MTDIIVETFDFRDCVPDKTHVLIHVNVGKMPPSRATAYLKSVREVTPLCQHLKKMGVPFTVVAMREASTDVKVMPAMTVEMDQDTNEVSHEDIEAWEAFDRANRAL